MNGDLSALFCGLYACAGMALLVLLPAAAVGIFLVVRYAIRRRRERLAAMRALAAAYGLTFYPDDPWDLPRRYEKVFDLFDQGSSRTASNILAGHLDGLAVLVFDYEYTTSSGTGKDETTTTWTHLVGVQELPIDAPHLSMRREGVFDRLASWVGYGDLNFESDEFSRRYHVACDDRKFAYDFLHARLIAYLLALGEAPALETRGRLMLLVDSQGDVATFRWLLDIGRQIIAAIPDYVLAERGTGSGPASQGA